MSIWKLNLKALNDQLTYDGSKFTWKPKKLKDNIFELLGVAARLYDVRVTGAPYKLDDETWAIDVEQK